MCLPTVQIIFLYYTSTLISFKFKRLLNDSQVHVLKHTQHAQM